MRISVILAVAARHRSASNTTKVQKDRGKSDKKDRSHTSNDYDALGGFDLNHKLSLAQRLTRL